MTASGTIAILPYSLDDTDRVVDAVRESFAELTLWMPWAHPGYSRVDSETWTTHATTAFAQGTAYEFTIVDGDGAYLGGCGLNQIDRINKRANLGYWIRSSAAGRGVMPRAVQLLRDWAAAITDLHRLEIFVAEGNVRSRRVAQKCGAQFEGTLRDRMLLNGVYHDASVFSLILPLRPADA
jgi:ribosomal-protein-serine acetyltransferase